MTETWCIRGRQIQRSDLEQIDSWMAAHPDWSRRRLSQELACLWDWRTPAGQLKDIATRDVLNRLEARGLLFPNLLRTAVRGPGTLQQPPATSD